jgi:hypothetical protein
MEKDPNRRLSASEALKHPWLLTNKGVKEVPVTPVAQNLTRSQTAKAETYYDGCELAKILTSHCQESGLQNQVEPVKA